MKWTYHPNQKKKLIHMLPNSGQLKDIVYENRKDLPEFYRSICISRNWKTCGFQYKNETNEGNKWNYRCNKVKLRAKQCSAVIFLLFDNRNTEVVELTILTIIWIKIKNRINGRSKSKSKIGDSKIVWFEKNPKLILAKLREKEVQVKRKHK